MADEEDLQDAREQQDAELEAVEAIFADDYALEQPRNADNTIGARFHVDLYDDTQPHISPHIRLIFTHPPVYPSASVPIHVHVHPLHGLPAAMRSKLQHVVERVAEDASDMVSVFLICDAARDWLVDYLTPGNHDSSSTTIDTTTAFETRDAHAASDSVHVVASKADGTPVTVESFATWRNAFMNELVNAGVLVVRDVPDKMTGRQLFETKHVVVPVESESFWEAEASSHPS